MEARGSLEVTPSHFPRAEHAYSQQCSSLSGSLSVTGGWGGGGGGGRGSGLDEGALKWGRTDTFPLS